MPTELYVVSDPERTGKGPAVCTLQVPAVTRVQEAYLREMIDTLNDLANVLYGISDEAGPHSTEGQYHMVRFGWPVPRCRLLRPCRRYPWLSLLPAPLTLRQRLYPVRARPTLSCQKEDFAVQRGNHYLWSVPCRQEGGEAGAALSLRVRCPPQLIVSGGDQ